MTRINLLPDELLNKTSARKIADFLKSIIASTFAVFFLGVLGGVSYLIILNVQFKNLSNRQVQLKTSVQSLETTEQQIVLVKDRIKKANQVLGDTKTEVLVESFNNSILNFVPAGVRIVEAKVTKESTTASFVVTSSKALTALFSNMTSSEDFSKVRLETLSFSPSVGYLVSVELFGESR